MEYQNGGQRDYMSDVGVEDEYSAPPSVVRRNPVLEGQLNVWHELRKYDQNNTGLISAADFRQALETLGIRFGSRPADKILVLMKFTADGMVDYLKLGEEVEIFMRTHGSPKPVRRDTSNLFAVTPRLTTDPEPLHDDREKTINLKTKERVFAVQDKIYEAFCLYERNEITSDRILEIIQDLGIQPTTATIRVLRRRDEVGSCSYGNLIQALCLLEERPHDLRASPVRSPFQSPGRSPVKDNGPAPVHKTRLMTLPPSLRDSNVITWSDDPKKERLSAKATTTRRVVCDEVVSLPSRFVQENYDPEITPQELAVTKQEKIFAMVRDFIEGSKSAVEFRTALREMGIDVNRELERVIGSHERDGSMRFQDFMRVLSIYHEGDIRYTYSEEQIQHKPNADIFGDTDIPPPITQRKIPQHTRGAGDFITWEGSGEDAGNNSRERPVSPTKRFDSSKDFAVWETEPVYSPLLTTQDTLGRPNTPKRHYNHANTSSVSNLMKWTDEEGNEIVQPPPEQPRRLVRGPGTARAATSDVNILTWSNASPLLPPSPRLNRSPDRTHAVLPNGLIHPKAPFGTERDQYYNINPHRPNKEERKR